MSLVYHVRCVVCTFKCNDKVIQTEKSRLQNHILYDHDYTDNLKAARFVGLIGKKEKRSRKWLAENLATLSILEKLQ